MGAGLFNEGTAQLGNSIVVGNTNGSSSSRDLYGPFTSGGHNLLGDTSDATGFPNTGDQLGASVAQAKLSPLQNNGGPTHTMLPIAGSVAIDQGRRGVDNTGAPLNTDQRGRARPLDDAAIQNAVGGDGSDIGAVEVDAPQAGPNFVVNTNDEHSDGFCGLTDCSLWDAIVASNANVANNSVITFAPEVRGFISITLQAGGINLTRPVTISGPGAGLLNLTGALQNRHFNVTAQNVVISGLSLSAGSFGPGGSIRNSGGLTLQDCALIGNVAVPSGNTGPRGGAICNEGGTLSLIRCSLIGNTAEGGFGGGGAILNDGGSVTLNGCTFSDNRSPAGGAIRNLATTTANASIAITNCTFSGNSTFSGSTASGSGGAIANLSGGGFSASHHRDQLHL